MSNGQMNPFERMLKLLAAILKMVVDNVRNTEEVNRYLQRVVDEERFVTILDAPRSASVSTEPAGDWKAEWARFYREVFGLTVDFTGVALQEPKPGFGWMVMVPEGLTQNQAWAACKRLFLTYSYVGEDFDRVVNRNDRTSVTAYAKSFRNRVEADEEHKNTSADSLAEQGIQSVTLLERFLLELWYCWKTGGGHLDLLNVTLCAGSRYEDGDVPRVSWRDSQFQVNYYRLGSAHVSLRARAAG